VRLETAWINETVELLPGEIGPEQRSELQAVAYLYNRLLGPVTSLNLLRPEGVDLPLYTSSCRHVTVGALLPDLAIKQSIADAILVPGGGKGVDPRSAVLGGLGEIAERLLAVLHFSALQARVVLATYDELVAQGRRALGPLDLPLFADEQYAEAGFPYQRFEADTPLRWLDGVDLRTGEAVAVPAQLVLLYYKHLPGEGRIGYPTTGGLAFHPKLETAALHALYEVIERDAVNVHWYRRVPPPRVEVAFESIGDGDRAWPRRWSTPHIPTVEVYLNRTDLPVSVFTTLAIDRSRDRRSLLGGGGAGAGRSVALKQALFELGQSRTSLKFYRRLGYKDIRPDSARSDMTDFFDAVIYYGFPENHARLEWYRSPEPSMTWREVPERRFDTERDAYDDLLAAVASAGLTPLRFDFGGACWPGVSVIKVFVPQLTQACVPSHPYLGHPRFHDPLPGLSDGACAYADLNHDPVPFP
jgi:ribosomal protein S12 methylthiotransferase accessory factor